ncbi:TPA: hypothetical protein SLG40_004431 [Serratia odorifera]|nr:hypothetical protein [Serratia odorifera]
MKKLIISCALLSTWPCLVYAGSAVGEPDTKSIDLVYTKPITVTHTMDSTQEFLPDMPDKTVLITGVVSYTDALPGVRLDWASGQAGDNPDERVLIAENTTDARLPVKVVSSSTDAELVTTSGDMILKPKGQAGVTSYQYSIEKMGSGVVGSGQYSVAMTAYAYQP